VLTEQCEIIQQSEIQELLRQIGDGEAARNDDLSVSGV